MFDPKQFLAETVSAPMSTSITPPPEGEWTMMVSTKVPVLEWFGEAKWKKDGVDVVMPTAKIPFEITDQRAKDIAGRENLVVYYDMFLDLTTEGRLSTEKEKNVRLGALREALGQNTDPTWTWQKLYGAGPFVGKVNHTKDKNRPDDTFAKVGRVTKIS